MLLGGIQVPRVIGKGGVIIREIREESGATVSILDRQIPEALQRREQRVALIKGSDEAMFTAVSGVIRSALLGVEDDAEPRGIGLLVPEKCRPHFGTGLIEDIACSFSFSSLEGIANFILVRIDAAESKRVQLAAWRVQEVVFRLARGGVLADRDFDIRDGAELAATAELPRVSGGPGTIGPTIWLRLLKDETAWIIGKRGNKIAKLRELARVNVSDAASPPFPPNHAILEIAAAPLERELEVLRLVIDDLATRPSPSDKLQLLLPSALLDGGLIGPGLATLAAELVPQGEEYATVTKEPIRCVEVRGSQRDRIFAAAAIYDAFQTQRGIAVGVSEGGSDVRQHSYPAVTASYPAIAGISTSVSANEWELRKLRESDEKVADDRRERESKDQKREASARDAFEREARARESRERAAQSRDAWNRSMASDGGVDSDERESLRREALARGSEARDAWRRQARPGIGHGHSEPGMRTESGQIYSGEMAHGVHEREARERKASERETRERDAREREARECDIQARETRDREARERESGEREARAREAGEREARERETRERESSSREAMERDMLEREGREREELVRQTREREACERESRERNARELLQACDVKEDITHTSQVAAGGDWTLFLGLPNIEVARFAASEDLSIARRTGTKITAGRSASGDALLQLHGTPLANASACYLVQEALWLSGAYSP